MWRHCRFTLVNSAAPHAPPTHAHLPVAGSKALRGGSFASRRATPSARLTSPQLRNNVEPPLEPSVASWVAVGMW